MKKGVVNFEIANKLKDKYFIEPTGYYYEYALTSQIDSETGNYDGNRGWKEGECNFNAGYFKNFDDNSDLSNKNWLMVAAPFVWEVIDWIEFKLNAWVHIYYNDRVGKWGWAVIPLDEREDWRIEDDWYKGENGMLYGRGNFDTKIDAINKAIVESLKLI